MATRLVHERFGECELLRIEGVDWIVRSQLTEQIYRIPPSRRIDFKPLSDASDASGLANKLAAASNGDVTSPASEKLSSDGVKRLLWAIRPSTSRGETPDPERTRQGGEDDLEAQVGRGATGEFKGAVKPPSPSEHTARVTPTDMITPTVPGQNVSGGHTGLHVSPGGAYDSRRLKRVFESLRVGLSPVHTELRPFAVGIEAIERKAVQLLDDVSREGGRTIVLRGAYGQGKTFSLQLLGQMALEAGFVVASTEIDAHENQLDKPHSVYRSLIKSLTFPDANDGGARELACRTYVELSKRLDRGISRERFAAASRRILQSDLQCEPLAWILSDPHLLEKPELLGLLACEPGVQVSAGRRSHISPAAAHEWPSFTAGTQGDFASYLLSGIGRLTRFLGYRGLILVLDEMEKWQDLNWQAQSRAGNLLGGLIWASTADEGSRMCNADRNDSRWYGNCDHSPLLEHSRRCGGYPFTTTRKCSLGVAIAMTPRGEHGPESIWSDYGLFEVADLPFFSAEHLRVYMQRIFPDYQRAYGLGGELTSSMLAQATSEWRQRGDQSTRTAIQSVLTVLDKWRDSPQPSSDRIKDD